MQALQIKILDCYRYYFVPLHQKLNVISYELVILFNYLLHRLYIGSRNYQKKEQKIIHLGVRHTRVGRVNFSGSIGNPIVSHLDSVCFKGAFKNKT